MGFVTGLQGGVSHDFDGRCHNSILPYLSHSSVVIPCESDPPVPNQEKRGGRERPPQKVGGHVTSNSGAESHASIRPHAGRSRPHLSLREGSETAPPGGALKETETDL